MLWKLLKWKNFPNWNGRWVNSNSCWSCVLLNYFLILKKSVYIFIIIINFPLNNIKISDLQYFLGVFMLQRILYLWEYSLIAKFHLGIIHLVDIKRTWFLFLRYLEIIWFFTKIRISILKFFKVNSYFFTFLLFFFIDFLFRFQLRIFEKIFFHFFIGKRQGLTIFF